MKVLEHFILVFCQWELICETGVINSGVKSRVQYEIQVSSIRSLRGVGLYELLALRARSLRAGGRNWSIS